MEPWETPALQDIIVKISDQEPLKVAYYSQTCIRQPLLGPLKSGC